MAHKLDSSLQRDTPKDNNQNDEESEKRRSNAAKLERQVAEK